MKFKKVLAWLMLVGLSVGNLSNVYAQEVKVNTDLKDAKVSVNIADIRSESNFLEYVKRYNTIEYLHKANSLSEWGEKDSQYLKGSIEKTILEKEIQDLKGILNSIRDKGYYKFDNGLKVYGYSQVRAMDMLMDSINARYMKLGYYVSTTPKSDVATIGSYRYDIYNKCKSNDALSKIAEDIFGDSVALPNEAELIETSKGVYKALTEYKMPNGITDNLDIYISPYYLAGYKGFAYSKSLVGIEEEVIIAPSIQVADVQSALDTTLHELGHIFLYDIMGAFGSPVDKMSSTNSLIVREVLNFYDGKTVDEACEEFAEDFRRYVQHKNGKVRADEKELVAKSQEKYDYIDSKLEHYETIYKGEMIPNLSINGEKIHTYYIGNLPLISVNNNNVTFEIDNWDFSGEDELYINIIKRDSETNSVVKIIENQKISSSKFTHTLDNGEYLITVHNGKEINYRMNEFIVKGE